MGVMRWDPFRDVLSIQDEMNQIFRRVLGQGGGGNGESRQVWAPPLDIAERKDAYLVTVEVPGVKPEDLDVTLEDGVLTVSGKREFSHDSSGEQWHRIERRYGAFRRTVTLPTRTQAEAIEASFQDGVLTVLVPKAEEARPRKIEIRSGSGAQAVEGTSKQA